jgi:hypothetical protein
VAVRWLPLRSAGRRLLIRAVAGLGPLLGALHPDVTQAAAEPVLSLSAVLEGGGAPVLRVSWVNQGRQALWLLTGYESDAGPQFDMLRLERGNESQPLVSPRKHARAHWCILPAQARHSVAIPLNDWVPRLGLAAPAPVGWRLSYFIEADRLAPTEAAERCGGGPPAAGPVLMWRGRIGSAPIAG